jgi:hypothetical protein
VHRFGGATKDAGHSFVRELLPIRQAQNLLVGFSKRLERRDHEIFIQRPQRDGFGISHRVHRLCCDLAAQPKAPARRPPLVGQHIVRHAIQPKELSVAVGNNRKSAPGDQKDLFGGVKGIGALWHPTHKIRPDGPVIAIEQPAEPDFVGRKLHSHSHDAIIISLSSIGCSVPDCLEHAVTISSVWLEAAYEHFLPTTVLVATDEQFRRRQMRVDVYLQAR